MHLQNSLLNITNTPINAPLLIDGTLVQQGLPHQKTETQVSFAAVLATNLVPPKEKLPDAEEMQTGAPVEEDQDQPDSTKGGEEMLPAADAIADAPVIDPVSLIRPNPQGPLLPAHGEQSASRVQETLDQEKPVRTFGSVSKKPDQPLDFTQPNETDYQLPTAPHSQIDVKEQSVNPWHTADLPTKRTLPITIKPSNPNPLGPTLEKLPISGQVPLDPQTQMTTAPPTVAGTPNTPADPTARATQPVEVQNNVAQAQLEFSAKNTFQPRRAESASRVTHEATTPQLRPDTPHPNSGVTDNRPILHNPVRRRVSHIEEPRQANFDNNASLIAAKRATLAQTKQVAPLVPWHASTALAVDQPAAKDLISVDPITGELRLSPLASGTTPTATAVRPELPGQIAHQLAEAVQQTPNRTIEIILKPQELGTVRLTLQQAEAGIVVNLVAERPETLELMRRNIDQLGAEFHELGYSNIAFSFAGTDADSDPQSQSDRNAATPNAETDDANATTDTNRIHLSNENTNGVDLRL